MLHGVVFGAGELLFVVSDATGLAHAVLKTHWYSTGSLTMQRIAVIAAALFVVATQPLHADDDAARKLHGIWRVTSLKLQIVGDDSPPRDVFGSNPKGYLIFTPEGRMAAVISAADRKPPAIDADNIALMKSVIAYTGKYTVEGDRWVTKVDVSWNEIYNVQDQVRFFKLEGERLTVRTAEQASGLLPGKKTVAILTMERER